MADTHKDSGGVQIDLSNLINEKKSKTIEADYNSSRTSILSRLKKFNYKPKEVKDYLDKYVIKQDEAKKVLSVTICDHYNHIANCLNKKGFYDKDYLKPNVLILGPTGSGKTYLVRTITKLLGVPFVKVDATKFSETGYAGNDVEDIIRSLVKNSDNNVELAEFGVVYIDEIDKIAAKNSPNRGGVSDRGVQTNLLKLMEESDVSLFSQTDISSQMEMVMNMMSNKNKSGKKIINTKHILFIMSGAFGHLNEIINKRIGNYSISYNYQATANKLKNDYSIFKELQTSDLIQYGFEPEFIGRLPVKVTCEQLEVNDLEDILTNSKGSILNQYKQDFQNYSIDVKFDSKAIRSISELAYKEKTGARGLLTVMEKLFRDYKFELPSTSINNLNITKSVIDNPSKQLKLILKKYKEDIENYTVDEDLNIVLDNFFKEYKIKISLTRDAGDYIFKKSTKNKSTVDILKQVIDKAKYGFELLFNKKNIDSFLLDKKFIINPEKEISLLIVDKFG